MAVDWATTCSINKVSSISCQTQNCEPTLPVALDQIMTALMENSNAHRPVPATDEILNKLKREVLVEGCT